MPEDPRRALLSEQSGVITRGQLLDLVTARATSNDGSADSASVCGPQCAVRSKNAVALTYQAR